MALAADGTRPSLAREMGLAGLTATGVCSMVGAGINVIPFMIQRNVPGIGPRVVEAFAFAAIPAVLAAIAYAILASAMPRAGGSYVYVSRALDPYLGFVASFSQWFALSIAIGVVSYVFVPFLRDITIALGWGGAATFLELGWVRLSLSVALLWTAAAINVRGVVLYQRLMVPLMYLTFILAGVVIIAGFAYDHADFGAAIGGVEAAPDAAVRGATGAWTFVSASAVLFASFIGFDSIAQAGGEAKNPGRNLPLAIGLAVGSVGALYILFTAAVYHAVPWQYIAVEAQRRDLTAPGLLGPLLPRFWTVVIVAAATVALAKDLPAMLLAVSRLMFAWAEDEIFPSAIARIHPEFRTPRAAIVVSAMTATAGIVGSHLAGDFFLGVDILVSAMLVNFLLMAVSVLTVARHNPTIAGSITVVPAPAVRAVLGWLGVMALGVFLAVHTWKDLTGPAAAWYFRSTPVWALVMAMASLVYQVQVRGLRRSGIDLRERFATLPPE